MPTELYRRIVADADAADTPFREATLEAWEPTPEVVDVYTDSIDSGRWKAICQHLARTLGPESRPAFGQAGRWHISAVTINGWTWIGFSQRAELDAFLAWMREQGWGDGIRGIEG